MMVEEVMAVNKAEKNKQLDNDILQCRVDISRVHNKVPPHDSTTPKNSETQGSSDAAETSTNRNIGPIPIETIPAKDTTPLPGQAASVDKKEPEKTLEMPSFDLAEEIMAEQRKITAIKRRPPGAKTDVQRLKPEVQPVDHIIEEPKPALSKQNKIIAEIVAKDIERLCRGDYSVNSK
jgi:hypothetical protein